MLVAEITTDNAITITHREVNNQYIQKYLNGYFEIIPVAKLHGNVVLADEDGQMKQLPVNQVACALTGKVVVGDVIVVGSDPPNFTDMMIVVATRIATLTYELGLVKP